MGCRSTLLLEASMASSLLSPLSSLLALFSLFLLLSSAAFQPPHASASTTGLGSPPPQESHLGAILANLGCQELSMAVSALASSVSSSAPSASITVFGPSDDSIRSCAACSAAAPFASTSSATSSPISTSLASPRPLPHRHLRIPRSGSNSSSAVKIFALSPFSCRQDCIPYPNSYSPPEIASDHPGSAIVRLMLHDAIVRLQGSG